MVLLVKLGLEEGPEASEAKKSTLLAAFTEIVDLEAGDLMGEDLDNPALDADLVRGAV